MTKKTIVDQMADLYEGYPGNNAEQLDTFLSELLTRYSDASRRLRKSIFLLLSFWGIGYLIGIGIVEEGQVGVFKVSKVESLIIAWPPILGILGYMMSTAAIAEGILQRAISQAYKLVLPKAYEHKLEYLMTIGTFIGVERVIKQEEPASLLQKIFTIWLGPMSLLMAFVPLLALGHVSYLLWISSTWGVAPAIASIVAGLIFWFRSLGVWLVGMKAAD